MSFFGRTLLGPSRKGKSGWSVPAWRDGFAACSLTLRFFYEVWDPVSYMTCLWRKTLVRFLIWQSSHCDSAVPNMLWFSVHFLNWVNTLQSCTETIPAFDRIDEYAEQKSSCFKFENNDVIYVSDSETYMRHVPKRSLYHVNMAEHAIRVWRFCLSAEKAT